MGNDPSNDPNGAFDSALCQAAFMQQQQSNLQQHQPAPVHPGSSLGNSGSSLGNPGSTQNLGPPGIPTSTPTQVTQSPGPGQSTGPSPNSAGPAGAQSLAPSPATSAVSSSTLQNDSSNSSAVAKTDTS